jgi:hypothetical protein
MKRRWILVALLVAGLAVTAVPQDPPAAKKLSTMEKIKQLDLMNQILPVLMKPEQVKALLPAIEAAQAAEAKLIKAEKQELDAIDERVEKALEAARARGEVPSRELQQDIHKMFLDFRMRRAAMAIERAEALLELVEKTLDAGQLKAIANAIRVEEVAPGKKPEDVTEREKQRGWVRLILLDPMAYDLLVELSRKS